MPSDLLDINFWETVLKAAGFSFCRLLITYIICLAISLAVAIWLVSFPRAEKIALPIFDLLQNVPPLAFYPLVAIIFIGLNFVEGAAIFVLLAGMFWPLLFGLIGAARNISQDMRDAAKIFGARDWKYIKYIFLPMAFPAMIAGSISSWSLGWNLLIVAEWIRYKNSFIQLSGLGGLLSKAVSKPEIDIVLFAVAVIAILLLVFIVHILAWRPLMKKAEKYKFD